MALANCNLEDQAAYCVLGIPLVLWLVFVMPYILALKPIWMFGQVISGRTDSFLLSKAMLTYGVFILVNLASFSVLHAAKSPLWVASFTTLLLFAGIAIFVVLKHGHGTGR